jgi:hypothetical protein
VTTNLSHDSVTLARHLHNSPRKDCAPSRDHGGFWAWRRAHSGQRDGASACSRGVGTIHRQEHATHQKHVTQKSAPNPGRCRNLFSISSISAARSQILVQMRLTATVIFNVVAGMIFLRQTPEKRSVAAGSWHEATSISSPRSSEMRRSGGDEMSSHRTCTDASDEI